MINVENNQSTIDDDDTNIFTINNTTAIIRLVAY